ncbi:NADPH-dependent 2,4-dienoyl-CoA reductase/sulfur reductase-like enzyme [Kitasatospora herbaricolor]|uniref:NAD(P)/FAD-dependent oxidoreductase n=1 Tax=Kitasatospora herbaricolor TaxID=68217 RepID=UPI00174A8CAE|nr:FAD-dependent oxidoreductase [Kitasatospora herbaricolor]MDQ0307839.1 NADPH-dependent 2,4-dienoyl-CoA reductase/sulfur reductase-like enzyme [Kitasatospora herbaricolor]
MGEQRNTDQVVVVGAGLAGAQCVRALRGGGLQGRIVLLGDEPHAPYDRPPLSKDVLLGKADATTLDIDYEQLGVELVTGRRATGLEPGVLHTDAGEVPYGSLVIATGSAPVALPGADRAHLLRTVDDALALRALLQPGARIVLVGAGWIGAETATVARALGCEVTVVEAGPTPVPGALPAEVGGAMTAWYREAGVDLRLGARVASVAPHEVLLADGTRLAADEVVVGIGVRPATGWLAGSGVDLDAAGAVLVDERLRTSLPGVLAAGDCVSYPSARGGGRLSVQHWDHALQSGAAAAASLLGLGTPYDPVPYFWSEQFGRMVQYAGRHGDGDDLLWRGAPGDPSWTVLWTRGGQLRALLTVDRPRDLAQGRRLLERGAVLDPAPAADPAVQLKAALAG